MKKPILRAFGFGFFGLGFAGIFLPLLPTVPLWIVAAIFFLQSDSQMAQHIFAHKTYGAVIEKFVKDGTLSKKAKRAALIGLACAAIIGIVLTYKILWLLIAQLFGVSCGAAYILTRPNQQS